MANIAESSREQSQGIEQVNAAVAEMDEAVQRNAATSEESASASEGMNAQALKMKNLVLGLVSLVGENPSENEWIKDSVPKNMPISSSRTDHPEQDQAAPDDCEEIKPEQLIFFDDDSAEAQ